MYKNRAVVLAKVETTYNTNPTPSASTDALLVENITISNEGLSMIERPVIKANLSAEQQIFGGMLRKVTFDIEMKGSGVAGTAPEVSALYQGCGLGETISAGVSVTYAPVTTGKKSITLEIFLDGLKYILTGSRGEVKQSHKARSKAMLSFEFVGHSVKPTDVALPTATYDSALPSAEINIPFTVGGYSATIQEVEFSLGNELIYPDSISASDGYGEIDIVGRDVNGSFNPEHTIVATKDWEGEFRAGTSLAMSLGSIGGTAGKIIDIDLPACYYRDISIEDRDKILTLGIPFGAIENTGDDEISIVYT